MAIRSQHNLYTGVNAHLQSILQNEPGGWESFHTDYISAIRTALDEQLPTRYLSRSEKSLQIGECESPFDEDDLSGIVIYQVGEGSLLGRPVTRIELLSPGNKPPGSHAAQYLAKRLETLKSGLRLVEVDLLHEQNPVVDALPAYPISNESYPFMLIVSDPRPTLEEGLSSVYGFRVGDNVPIIEIPLAGADNVIFDFGAVYNSVYESSRFFITVVDYEKLPPHSERYSEADQQAIRHVMEQAAKDNQP